MKIQDKGIVPGIVLIVVGIIFLGYQFDWPYFDSLLTWQSIMMIIGLIIIFSSFMKGQRHQIFPGIIIFGLGLHFWASDHLFWWPEHWTMYTLIVSIACLLKYLGTRDHSSLVLGIILLVISLFFGLFSGVWGVMESTLGSMSNWWPLLLIGFGVYIIFSYKKK